MPKNVLVVGMPRSGTSLTASIFANKNYFVAEDEKNSLRDSDEFNPSGYWEAEDLIKCNAEIFTASGFNFDNTWLYDSISDEQASKILQLQQTKEHKELVTKFNSKSPWIWKDPRLCYTLGYWWPLLNPETTKVLFLKRDPIEIYDSFIRLKWRTNSNEDKTDVISRIEKHLHAAEISLEKYNIPHVVIYYSDYKNHPTETVKKLNSLFELNLDITDIGYNHKYNNHSWQGTLTRLTDKVGDILPKSTRTLIKSLIPKFIWKILNPNRYTK